MNRQFAFIELKHPTTINFTDIFAKPNILCPITKKWKRVLHCIMYNVQLTVNYPVSMVAFLQTFSLPLQKVIHVTVLCLFCFVPFMVLVNVHQYRAYIRCNKSNKVDALGTRVKKKLVNVHAKLWK